MNRNLKIVIGADTVPTKSNEGYLKSGQEDLVFNGVKNIFLSADISVVNLECPLTNCDMPIKKEGPCLKSDPFSINGLISAGINVFSLANNHIMDFGLQGLKETLSIIASKNAHSLGAGANLEEARKILHLKKNGYKVALISVAEHEFSIAQDDYPGANPFDPYDTLDDIRKSRLEADIVIVLYHGGIEHYRYPSPSLQKLCRNMVKHGADVVVCQHSHCVGAYEKYENGHIIYGQGNLLFDYSNNPMWQDGMLIQILLENKGKNVGFIPLIKKGSMIDVANGRDKEVILTRFEERSSKIVDKAFIKDEWAAFCDSRKYNYLYTFLGFGYLLRKLDRKLNYVFSKFLLNRERFLVLYNYIFCEAHLDVQRTFLERNYEKDWR